jgi:TonB family protein
MIWPSESTSRITEQLLCRAHATPSYWAHGVGASLATHVLAVGGYTLLLMCSSWLASADLPEWLPPQSGVNSRPQVASQAIVLEATFAEPVREESQAVAVPLPEAHEPPQQEPLEPALTELRRLQDTAQRILQQRDKASLERLPDAPDAAAAAQLTRASYSRSPRPASSPPRAAQVARRGHGVSIESITSVASVAAQESHGAETDALPQQLYNPEPEYPSAQYAARVGGTVRIRIRLREDGRVGQATVHRTSGVPALDNAALAAVRRWRFEAASTQRPTARELVFPIRFVPPE